MDFALSIGPIALLIVLMTKPKGWPSHIALPTIAAGVYFIRLIYFSDSASLVNATVVKGLLTAWTPILIIAGAILMFKTMEKCGSMNVIRIWLNSISSNPIAQLMIVSWAFGFVIEGASGFGTPAALAAPILVGMGFPALRVAMVCLIMNTVPVSFGAVGTPTWFGMGQLGLSEQQILQIGIYSAIIHTVAALVIPVIALSLVVRWKEIQGNLSFILLSIASCMLPYLLLSTMSYEFPSLVGGAIGFAVTIYAASRGIGLQSQPEATSSQPPMEPEPAPKFRSVMKATMPLWGSVLVLVVTRIPQLGIKSMLTDRTAAVEMSLGSFGNLTLTRSLGLRLQGIFDTATQWTFDTLYIPALIPFLLMSIVCVVVNRISPAAVMELISDVGGRMRRPIVSLLGALVMVELMMANDDRSMVILIGKQFAEVSGSHWGLAAAYLGSLGTFFSGSATISNLTFSSIQLAIAQELDLRVTLILSLQSVGAALGNMVAINNIVAVCSILGLNNQEGTVLKKTVWPMLLYGLIAALMSIIIGNLT